MSQKRTGQAQYKFYVTVAGKESRPTGSGQIVTPESKRPANKNDGKYDNNRPKRDRIR